MPRVTSDLPALRPRRAPRLPQALPLLLVLLAASCPPRRAPDPPEPVASGAGESQPAAASAPREEPALVRAAPGPPIRIGLTEEAASVVVACDAGLVVRTPEGAVLLEATDLERVELAPVGARPEATFEVQLASLSTEPEARSAVARARTLGKGRVVPDPDTGRYAVRLGPLPSKEAAEAAKLRARSAGWDGAFVVPAPIGPASSGAIALRAGARPARQAGRHLVVEGKDGRPVSVLGDTWDGRIEVLLNASAKLTVVDVLGIEDYLKGVVPNEMGPSLYPRIEALKAQAVAARTYALRNLGQYAGAGFDLCATPKCQVYKGTSTHHPMSDRAVDESASMVAAYGGEPIRALFTSTCGGRTESVEEVFHGDGAPYLVSVGCAPESAPPASTAERASRLYADDGDLVNDEVALARLAGLPVPAAPVRAWIEKPLDAALLADWISAGARATSRPAAPPQAGRTVAPVTREQLVGAVVSGLDLARRAEMLARDGPSELVIVAPDRRALRDPAAWSLLADLRGIAPYPDGSLAPAARATRAAGLRALAAALRGLGVPELRKVSYVSYQSPLLRLVDGERTFEGRLSATAALFRDVRGEALPVPDLPLRGGDSLLVHLAADGAIDYAKGLDLGKGEHYDRFSKYSEWEVVYDLAELEAKIAARTPVAGVVDLEILRRSPSGRVAELRVAARDGGLTLTGLDIRWGLGVRENLFEIEKERDAGGSLRRVRFVGRGFGHGVGMCQVGAYGMALAGARYDEILRHYYPGIEVKSGY